MDADSFGEYSKSFGGKRTEFRRVLGSDPQLGPFQLSSLGLSYLANSLNSRGLGADIVNLFNTEKHRLDLLTGEPATVACRTYCVSPEPTRITVGAPTHPRVLRDAPLSWDVFGGATRDEALSYVSAPVHDRATRDGRRRTIGSVVAKTGNMVAKTGNVVDILTAKQNHDDIKMRRHQVASLPAEGRLRKTLADLTACGRGVWKCFLSSASRVLL